MTVPGLDLAGTTSDHDVERLVGADRVLAVLKQLAGHAESASLDDLARAVGSAKPTVHRALACLVRAGFAERDGYGRYRLGDEFLRLAFSHHDQRPEHVHIRPALERLTQRFGETAHYAVLDGREVVYRAKVDPTAGAVRLTSVIGGRNPTHVTAVGKLLLAHELLTIDALKTWIGDRALERRTPNTRCDLDSLFHDLEQARQLGYATDDEENEIGISCLAVPVYSSSRSIPSGAVSVSALTYRTPLTELVGAVDEIRRIVNPTGATT